jgi:tetratricopeptide (TPR) repeat protein
LELSRWSAAGILAAEGPGWWTFTSSMQRESLLEAAGERSKAHHGAIAAVLRSMRAEGTPVRAARLGVHCFSAGAFAEATPLLQEAAKEATGAEQVRLVGLWEQCVLARGLPRSHPHRVEAGLARVRILLRTGRFDPARSLASTLVGDASNPDQTSRAHLALANALYGGNLAEPARAAYEAAARGPAARVKVAALRGLARLHTRAHNRAGALDMLERAQRLATPRQAATLALERARVLAPHQPDEQRAVLEEVVAEAERMQHPKLVALALSELASLHRRAEALQAAEELFSRALDLFEQIDDNNALYVRANLTMLRMRAGSPDEARQALLTIRRSGALLQLRSFVADMDSLLLATLIYAEHAAWEEARGVAEARVPTGNRVLSWSWNMAAVLAHDGGQPARAQALWRLAHAEAEAADDAPLVHTIAARLDGNPA